MVVWIVGIIAALVLIVIVLAFLAKRGTLYIHNPMGYMAFSGGLEPLREVSLDQFKALIPHVIGAEKIDHLFVSITGDHYVGVCLYENEDVLEFELAYGAEAELTKIDSFMEYMRQRGISQTEGERSNEPNHLEYVIPKNPESIYDMCLVALKSLPGTVGETVFVQASLIKEGVGSGICFKPDKDRLSELL